MSDTYIDGKRVEPVITPQAEKEVTTAHESDTESIVREMKLRQYRDFFGSDESDDDNLEYVIEHFSDIREPEALIAKLRKIDLNLSKDPFESKLQRIYRYVRLLKTITNGVAEL